MAEVNNALVPQQRRHSEPVGVDDRTEILTARGWATYDTLTDSDQVFVLDPGSLRCRFAPLIDVARHDVDAQRMRHIEVGGFSSLTSGGLPWPNQHTSSPMPYCRRATAALSNQSRLFRAAPRADAPAPTHSDAFVELVAWFWCEGYVQIPVRADAPGAKFSPVAYITQSEAVNGAHCDAIRRALTAEFRDAWSCHVAPDGSATFRLRVGPSALLLAATGQDKAPTPAFLRSLTVPQLRLFLDRCLDADGHINQGNGGQRVWYQLSEHGMGMFQMACALAGVATNAHQGKDYGNRFGRPPIVVTLLQGTMVKPLDSIRVKSYGYKPGAPRTPAVNEWVKYTGTIWVPTTVTGTWLARRRWSVYFAGGHTPPYVPRTGSPPLVSASGEQLCFDLPMLGSAHAEAPTPGPQGRRY